MKTLKYLFFILCLPLFAGCFEDETTVDTVRISEISIDTLKMQKVYNIDQNEELLIPTEGLVSQSERQLPLTYEGGELQILFLTPPHFVLRVMNWGRSRHG